MKHYIRVTSGPYSGAVYEFAAKKDALALARALEKVRPRSMDYGNDRDGFPEVHLKNRRAVNVSRRQHSTKTASASSGRWMHKDIARSHSVPEDVVRRIYASVQTAKKQGLYGGHAADLVERDVGRKLVGGEYDVYAKAKEHLSYDPPGGYSGPRPTGPAKEPPRAKYDDPTARFASVRGTRGPLITHGWRATERSACQRRTWKPLRKGSRARSVPCPWDPRASRPKRNGSTLPGASSKSRKGVSAHSADLPALRRCASLHRSRMAIVFPSSS